MYCVYGISMSVCLPPSLPPSLLSLPSLPLPLSPSLSSLPIYLTSLPPSPPLPPSLPPSLPSSLPPSLPHSLPDAGEEEKMLAEGVSRFCEDANLDPTSLTVLIVAWKFKAATQCEFTRKEFVEGMSDLG